LCKDSNEVVAAQTEWLTKQQIEYEEKRKPSNNPTELQRNPNRKGHSDLLDSSEHDEESDKSNNDNDE